MVRREGDEEGGRDYDCYGLCDNFGLLHSVELGAVCRETCNYCS